MNYFKLKIDDDRNLASFIRANLHDGGVTIKGTDGYLYARTRWSETGIALKPGVADVEKVDYSTYSARLAQGASISSRH